MFSRLYRSAKSIFIENVQNQETTAPAVIEKSPETMVTTRQKLTQEVAEEEIDEENSINVYVPDSTKRRQKRALSEEDTTKIIPSSSRKRKKLPVRAKEIESPDPTKTRPVVEILVKKMSPAPDNANISAIDDEAAASEEQESEVDEGPDGPQVEAEKLPEAPKHRRFGSEPVEDEFFSTAREVAAEEDRKVVEDSEEDSDDSGDDAPEAVGIQEAAKSIKLKEMEAAKSVKE